MPTFKTDKAVEGQRADVFIASKFPEFTRSSLTKLFDNELIKVNKKVAKAGQKLHAGDILVVDDSPLHTKPPEIVIPIVYEDENVVVMDKPAGILTHSKGAINNEATVASFLGAKINDPLLTGNRAGIVHRLDRATSGVIIGAKNAPTQAFLQKQFAQRRTKKIYLAVTEGWPEQEKAIIEVPIGRNPREPQTFKVDSTGKAAQTEYTVLKKVTRAGKRFALLELKPTTGRTHQLRVHLKYIGHPIVGDLVYGHAGDSLLLHAESLELTLPGGVRKVFKATKPKYFKGYENDGRKLSA